MTGAQRREQLLEIGRRLFAEKGFEGTSVEEIATTAGVSKPVVYEHFGGKDGLYAAVVEAETHKLLRAMMSSLTVPGPPRQVLEIATLTLLDYIDSETDGFRILVRDSPITQPGGGFASLISDVTGHVEHILGEQFTARGFDARMAPLYAQMLVGMVALTGQFWLDHRKPEKAVVAAHLVNLAWNGLTGLETSPRLRGDEDDGRTPRTGDGTPVDVHHQQSVMVDVGGHRGGPTGSAGQTGSTGQSGPAGHASPTGPGTAATGLGPAGDGGREHGGSSHG